jgi:hypothetical protein
MALTILKKKALQIVAFMIFAVCLTGLKNAPPEVTFTYTKLKSNRSTLIISVNVQNSSSDTLIMLPRYFAVNVISGDSSLVPEQMCKINYPLLVMDNIKLLSVGKVSKILSRTEDVVLILPGKSNFIKLKVKLKRKIEDAEVNDIRVFVRAGTRIVKDCDFEWMGAEEVIKGSR